MGGNNKQQQARRQDIQYDHAKKTNNNKTTIKKTGHSLKQTSQHLLAIKCLVNHTEYIAAKLVFQTWNTTVNSIKQIRWKRKKSTQIPKVCNSEASRERETHTDTHTHTHTHAHTHTHIHTHTQTNTQKHTHTRARARTHRLTLTDSHSCTYRVDPQRVELGNAATATTTTHITCRGVFVSSGLVPDSRYCPQGESRDCVIGGRQGDPAADKYMQLLPLFNSKTILYLFTITVVDEHVLT